jgi:hypothetical protein
MRKTSSGRCMWCVFQNLNKITGSRRTCRCLDYSVLLVVVRTAAAARVVNVRGAIQQTKEHCLPRHIHGSGPRWGVMRVCQSKFKVTWWGGARRGVGDSDSGSEPPIEGGPPGCRPAALIVSIVLRCRPTGRPRRIKPKTRRRRCTALPTATGNAVLLRH